jgi:choline dehydrogenase
VNEPNGSEHAGTIVVGGGTAGAVVAARLAEAGESVLLLEAGPDYGARRDQRWPAELLDALEMPPTHPWGYNSGKTYRDRTIEFQRARVIGGCSSHNGCAAIWGSRLDYDGWAASGNVGWATDDLVPYFRRVMNQLHVRIFGLDELTPFQRAFLETAPAVGIPVVRDLNDLDENVGVGANPANIVDGVRWNTSFGYLDPVRERRNLTIIGDALVDRVLVDRDRALGVAAVVDGSERRFFADRVVLAGGAYGSPAVLLRSGIGDPGQLSALGIPCVGRLPGVGGNLHDHPAVAIVYEGTDALSSATDAFASSHWAPDEQVIAKARSPHCGDGFDLHIVPYSTHGHTVAMAGRWNLVVACLTPRSRGRLTIAGTDPTQTLIIEHEYLSDDGGEDLRVLTEGIELTREIAADPGYASLLGAELRPGPNATSEAEIQEYVRTTSEHYYHPVGTCKMGPDSDVAAVVGAGGRVHGFTNLYVADASIMPVVPRANTNIPAAVVGERIAATLV